jgi:hypothetical protein
MCVSASSSVRSSVQYYRRRPPGGLDLSQDLADTRRGCMLTLDVIVSASFSPTCTRLRVEPGGEIDGPGEEEEMSYEL